MRPLLSILVVFCVLALPASAQSEPRPIQPESAWERMPDPLIHGFFNMYQPCVREFPGEEYRFKMWFFGWAAGLGNPDIPGCDAIYHARSKDLKAWEIYAGDAGWDTTMDPKTWKPVLCASDRWYDDWHNGDPSVVVKDGKFFMAYSATSRNFDTPKPGHPNKMQLCVMGAMSDDGVHWTKTDQPLLIKQDPPASEITKDNWVGDFHRPSLMWDNNRWCLWFDYWVPNKGLGMGYAENIGDFAAKDGFKIQNDLMRPLITNWPNPEVIKAGGKYYAFSDPGGYPGEIQYPESGWTTRQLCEASSPDGLNWTVTGFIAPDADAPACQIPQAAVIKMDGQDYLYLFYSTQRGGYDENKNFDYTYDRIRAMRRPLR